MTSLDGDHRRPARRGRGRRRRWRRRAGSASSRARRLRPPTVSADPRHRCRSCGPGCRPTPPGTARRAPSVVGSRPSRRRNSSTLTANAASTWPARLENTSSSSPGQAGDLGLAVDDRLPADPVAVGQLGAQHRLVQAAQHPLVALQVAGVERQPPPVVGLDLGRDDGVGVHLRVVGPRRRLAERRHRQPERVGVLAAAVRPAPGSSPRTAPDGRAPPARRCRGRRAGRDHR